MLLMLHNFLARRNDDDTNPHRKGDKVDDTNLPGKGE